MAKWLLAAVLLCSIVCGGLAFWLNGERAVLAQRNEVLEQRLAAAESARAAAERKLGEAAAVASALDAIREKQLHLIYRDLRRFTGPSLSIQDKYLSSIELGAVSRPSSVATGTTTRDCSFIYENKSSKDASPSVSLFFFNEYGIMTGVASDHWMIQTVGPGERRVEKSTVSFEHGEPVYWRVEVH